MIVINESTSCYVYSEPVDMRKSIDGLSYLVCDLEDKNPQDGSVFIFYNRQRDKVKLLYWDKNGFIMHYKRLERSRFKVSKHHDELATVSSQQLSWLLAGLDYQLMHNYKELDYTNYY